MTNIPFSLVLAAGGMGTRMGVNVPKQYLHMRNKPIALFSFEIFLAMPELDQVVVVCDPIYQELFQKTAKSFSKKITFASPGIRRQDSVFNGIEKLNGDPLVCVHDAARPFITMPIIRNVIESAEKYGGSVVGVPLKATIKMCDNQKMIVSTPDRSKLWEMQTPQVVRLSLLKQGYAKAQADNLTVTDDVSLLELIGKPAKVVEGSYFNIKITTPDDLILSEQILDKYVLL
ncbi:MAG: 2-C-methyl-D-erythritol 4-phosphate cytidylyltransferase [Parachlamydiaceae bacterium]|nr:2-C-methyl-D-erythritol 4-phosphate cytidylyltransferase [Parachlamydiaceae bacterium]